jgi:hypothetical protein
MLTTISATQHARGLRRRKEELELRLQRCHAADDGNRPNPSLGREVDDVRAQLAMVRRELLRLDRR